jgi:NAD(P)H-dependent FMN reductase
VSGQNSGDSGQTQPGKPLLQIVIASTRPGRVGLPVATWFTEVAHGHRGFAVEVVDLAEVALPMLDEPNHPRLAQYTHEHTKQWSRTISRADAFVMVTPEYNFGINAALKNALDYLFHEWSYKPVGFVTYGQISAGTRALQMTKQIVTALKMMPMVEAVNIPFVGNFVTDGVFHPNDPMDRSAVALLDELARWTAAMQPMQQQAAAARTT